MDQLDIILCEEVQKYAGDGRGANVLLFPICDITRQIYAVNAVDFPHRKTVAGVVVLARVVNNLIVVEEDATDKPLVDALLQRGVPRDQIVLAYTGEVVPDQTISALDA